MLFLPYPIGNWNKSLNCTKQLLHTLPYPIGNWNLKFSSISTLFSATYLTLLGIETRWSPRETGPSKAYLTLLGIETESWSFIQDDSLPYLTLLGIETISRNPKSVHYPKLTLPYWELKPSQKDICGCVEKLLPYPIGNWNVWPVQIVDRLLVNLPYPIGNWNVYWIPAVCWIPAAYLTLLGIETKYKFW